MMKERVLRNFGVSENEIAKARAECEAQFSDGPFRTLLEASPRYQELLRQFAGDK